MALALCLRRLHSLGKLPLHVNGVPLIAYGLQSADRVDPFTRHVKIPISSVRLRTLARAVGEGAIQLTMDDASVPPSPKAAGVRHR